MKNRIRYGMAAILLPMSFVLQACNADDIIAGALIGGVIGGLLDDDYDSTHNHHRPPCFRPGTCAGVSDNGLESSRTLSKEQMVTIKLAQQYEIPYSSARTLSKALLAAKDTQMNSVRALGLSDQDLLSLYKQEMISMQGLESVSQKLRLSVRDTAIVIEKISQDIAVVQAERSQEIHGLLTNQGSD